MICLGCLDLEKLALEKTSINGIFDIVFYCDS